MNKLNYVDKICYNQQSMCHGEILSIYHNTYICVIRQTCADNKYTTIDHSCARDNYNEYTNINMHAPGMNIYNNYTT